MMDNLIEMPTVNRPESREPTQENLDKWIMYTCIVTMADAAKDSDKVAAAKTGVQFLAVKAKMGPDFGGGFDEAAA